MPIYRVATFLARRLVSTRGLVAQELECFSTLPGHCLAKSALLVNVRTSGMLIAQAAACYDYSKLEEKESRDEVADMAWDSHAALVR